MTTFATEENGEVDDRVRLQLGGAGEVRIFEDYAVHTAILQQPAQFQTRLSAGKRLARELLADFPPGPKTPFTLSIGPCPQFTGELDEVEVAGPSGSTSVSFKGRDLSARLFDGDIDADRSFENVSYKGLVEASLKDVGLKGKLVTLSNEENLRVRTGRKVKIVRLPIATSEVKRVTTGAGEKVTVTASLGESWLDFLQRHLNKYGLFLWSTADGHFVISRPARDAEPLYRFVRQRGQRANVCNVEDAHLTFSTTRRFSEVVVFTRSGKKREGRNHLHGSFVDEEMKALGFNRRRVYRDANVETVEEAAAYAARKVGELNRASWRLVYTISGHTAPSIGGGRAVIVPDTIAEVQDDELGLNGNFYVESCEYRSPPRKTVVTLMRPRDLVFDAFKR